MKPLNLITPLALALFVGSTLMAGTAMADRPSDRGEGKSGKASRDDRRGPSQADRREEPQEAQREVQRDDRRADKRDGDRAQGRFEDRHRTLVRDYYTSDSRGSRCPPGLAKKNNGCMPPGQAKKWQVGQPLPRDVVYYAVPQPLVLQIGPPPSGYRYVRVAADILMIAIGTGMVVDAIQNLGR